MPQSAFLHKLELWREVVICGVCGCYSGPGTHIRDLRDPCGGKPAARAHYNWQKVRQGLHPKTGLPMQKLAEEEVLQFEFAASGGVVWAQELGGREHPPAVVGGTTTE